MVPGTCYPYGTRVPGESFCHCMSGGQNMLYQIKTNFRTAMGSFRFHAVNRESLTDAQRPDAPLETSGDAAVLRDVWDSFGRPVTIEILSSGSAGRILAAKTAVGPSKTQASPLPARLKSGRAVFSAISSQALPLRQDGIAAEVPGASDRLCSLP